MVFRSSFLIASCIFIVLASSPRAIVFGYRDDLPSTVASGDEYYKDTSFKDKGSIYSTSSNRFGEFAGKSFRKFDDARNERRRAASVETSPAAYGYGPGTSSGAEKSMHDRYATKGFVFVNRQGLDDMGNEVYESEHDRATNQLQRTKAVDNGLYGYSRADSFDSKDVSKDRGSLSKKSFYDNMVRKQEDASSLDNVYSKGETRKNVKSGYGSFADEYEMDIEGHNKESVDAKDFKQHRKQGKTMKKVFDKSGSSTIKSAKIQTNPAYP
jgi:hypothetical protein